MAIFCLSWLSHATAFTPEDIIGLKHVTEPRISPNSEQVAYLVSEPDLVKGTQPQRLWLISTHRSQKPLAVTRPEQHAHNSQWSPDSQTLYFLANAPEQQASQLWAYHVDTKSTAAVTTLANGINKFAVSPSGRFFALTTPHQPAPQGDDHVMDTSISDDLVIYDRQQQVSKHYPLASGSVTGLDWGANDNQLMIKRSSSGEINDFFYHSTLHVFNLKTGNIGPSLQDTAIINFDWSDDGRNLASCQLGEGYIGVSCFLRDMHTRKKIPLPAEFKMSPMQVQWLPDNKTLLLAGPVEAHYEYVWFDTEKMAVQHRLVQGGILATFSISNDGTVAYSGDTTEHPAEVWLANNGIRNKAPLTQTNPQTQNWTLGNVKQVSWQSHIDQRPIYGVLITPPDYQPGHPIKTVIQIHGGPEWGWWKGWLASWHEWAQLLASQGYAVLLPNPRGSIGQGPTFARLARNDWGGNDFADIMDGVDWLIAQDIADPQRLGIGGWSYGGFMSAWAIGHTDRFKAAVIGAAPTDLVSFSTTTDTPDFPLGYYGDIIKNRRQYWQHSPIAYVQHAHTPALILHGNDDPRVPVAQGLGFYRALRMLNRPAQMVRYHHAVHWITNPKHQVDIDQRVLAFFNQHLSAD